MTVLSDHTIEMRSTYDQLIHPFTKQQLQPASYDLQLKGIRVGSKIVDWYMLQPKEFVLASTMEQVKIPANMVGRMEGKSSRAREGLIVHTAGFVDPGFIGQLTLEITNLGDRPYCLKNGMFIAQIAFQYLDNPAIHLYGSPALGSHYQGQSGPTPAAITF